MIRRDKTNYDPNKDKYNWTNDMYRQDELSNRDLEEQKAIINNWQAMSESKNEAEKAEWELNRRIAAVTETDNADIRQKEAIKRYKIAQKYDEIIRSKMTRGQTEEEFEEERHEYGALHRRALKEAMRSIE